LLRNVGIYAWIALENANIYKKMELQKKVIENQNEDITAGIRYAKTIQQAILPARELISSIFENFIIYRPKEIVSGDFYVFEHFPETKSSIAAVLDCTGHGIGGSFMSMIGNRLLTDIIKNQKIYDPAAILTKLDHEIRIALKQDISDNSDGMDACLVFIEEFGSKKQITFAGAKRPLYCFRNGQSIILMPSRRTIGGFRGKLHTEEFKNTNLDLSEGDILYLTSDGFSDQSNPDRRRYSADRLISLLSDIHSQPMETQAVNLVHDLELFSGGFPQIDDITILGLKL
jgi:serine phosphatase RsbU (regulator of sigma subunit)